MNCSRCTNAMDQVYGQKHYHCAECNLFEFDEATLSIEKIESLGKETAFFCPKCEGVALTVGLMHGQLQVCFCTNCRGFVVDSQSLGTLATQLRDSYTGREDQPIPIDPTQLDQREHCPACHEMMDAHPYYGPGNIVLDTCMHCKLAWLDHGELGKIVRAPGLRNQTATGNFESAALRDRFYEPSMESTEGRYLW